MQISQKSVEMPNTHFTEDYLLCLPRNVLQAFDHRTTGEKAAVSENDKAACLQTLGKHIMN